LYRVNYIMPWVGADNFILNVTSPPSPPHEELLFYYGEWTYLPLRITVDKTVVHIGEEIMVFVEYFNDTSSEWCPLENATVHFMGRLYSTNAKGYAIITVYIDPLVWAEKEGFVRSDTIRIVILRLPLLLRGPYWYMGEVRYWIVVLEYRAVRLLE